MRKSGTMTQIALCWQANQLRRIKGYIIFEGARDAIADRVRLVSRQDDTAQHYREADYDLSAASYVQGKPVGSQLGQALESSGMLLDRHFGMGYLARAGDLEHIDRLIFAHEKRRDDLIDRFASRRG